MALGNIKVPPLFNFTFNWEANKGIGKDKSTPPVNFYIQLNWEDQQRYPRNDSDDDYYYYCYYDDDYVDVERPAEIPMLRVLI